MVMLGGRHISIIGPSMCPSSKELMASGVQTTCFQAALMALGDVAALISFLMSL